jgi:hypothetical protein
MAATRPGSYHSSHSQFDTIRKLRSALSSLWMASAQGASYNLSSGRDRRGYPIILTDCPTESEWFKRFSQGMRKRMGQDVRPQLGFLCGGHGDAAQKIRRPMEGSAKRDCKDDTLGSLVYSSLSFTNALRGNEGFKLDLYGLRNHINRGGQHPRFPHVVAPLVMGRFKGRDGERLHLLFMVPVTQSGIKTREYLEWLVIRREEQGIFNGPAFCDSAGKDFEVSMKDSLSRRCMIIRVGRCLKPLESTNCWTELILMSATGSFVFQAMRHYLSARGWRI